MFLDCRRPENSIGSPGLGLDLGSAHLYLQHQIDSQLWMAFKYFYEQADAINQAFANLVLMWI